MTEQNELLIEGVLKDPIIGVDSVDLVQSSIR